MREKRSNRKWVLVGSGTIFSLIPSSFFEDDRPDDGATISYSQPMEEDDMLDDQASEDMVAEAAAAAPVPRKDASAQTFRRSRRRNADKLKEKLETLGKI